MASKPDRWRWILEAVQAIVGIISSLAGVGFLFVLTGHIIVNCYTQNMQLYGLADFTDRFVLDANISFMNSIFTFLHERNSNAVKFLSALFVVVVLAVVNGRALASGKWLTGKLVKKVPAIGWLVSHAERYFFHGVILLCIFLGVMVPKIEKTMFVYVLCLPVLIGGMIVLSMVIPAALREKRDRKLSVSLLLLTSVIMVAIPFLYGRSIYDMSVYEVDAISYQPPDTNLTAIDSIFLDAGSHNAYVVANYSDKLIFVIDDANTPGYTHLIPVDKSKIGSFRLKIENSHNGELALLKLRTIVSLDTLDSEEQALGEYAVEGRAQPAVATNEEAYLKSFGAVQ